MRLKVAVYSLSTILIVCGLAVGLVIKSHVSNAHNIQTVSGSPAYSLEIKWNGREYILSRKIPHIGNQIGVVQEYVSSYLLPDTKKTVSNIASAPVGTKIFAVPGTSSSKAIALKIWGHYEEAIHL